MKKHYWKATNVDCPKCGAQRASKCVDLKNYVHKQRMKLSKKTFPDAWRKMVIPETKVWTSAFEQGKYQ